SSCPGPSNRCSRGRGRSPERRLERETGIEPATNSLEGCDSTTELLPPARSFPTLHKPGLPPPPRVASDRLSNGRPCLERMLETRKGLELSKPLGRQIYFLLLLPVSLPRHRCFF